VQWGLASDAIEIMFNSVDIRPDMGPIMMFWVAKRAIL
jgi:hypothetical protein